MAEASFVAGDWGTSRLRLLLCDAQGAVLDSCTGPGAADVGGRFAETFESLTAQWEKSRGTLPAVLCGMVGSSFGWAQAPYVACPAMPGQIADACVTLLGGRIHIVPGLSCRNRFGAPEFLRGEETQILGASHLLGTLRQGSWVLCHPGTHTKWVVLRDGVVREFFTAPTGELFAILRDHSVLVRKPGGAAPGFDANAFADGLARCNEFPQAQLLHRLFECRSRQLSGELEAQSADAFLSGLLIAGDVHGAQCLLSDCIDAPVVLIGAAQLTQLYAIALGRHGRDAVQVDGSQAALAGLTHVHRRFSRQAVVA
jgi:2-dehydro-3-deoxygalactonokinase